MNKKNITVPPELNDIEAHLAGTLKRVAPSKDIVRRLRGRIRMPQREEIAFRLQDWERLFFVFSGVLSGMLLIVTVARALYFLSGRRNL
jgi:hypothetical protein